MAFEGVGIASWAGSARGSWGRWAVNVDLSHHHYSLTAPWAQCGCAHRSWVHPENKLIPARSQEGFWGHGWVVWKAFGLTMRDVRKRCVVLVAPTNSLWAQENKWWWLLF